MAGLISIVFSFRNEQEVLEELIRQTTAVLEREPEDYELIFVNDDSTDGSLELLKQARTTNPRIKIVNMSRRFGVSECTLAGMAQASGDAVIYMDTDLQDPPAVIPALLEKWREGADVVHTVRTARQGEHPLKMLATKVGYWLISIGSIVRLTTNAGDFKLLSRRAVRHLLSLRETDPYLRGLVVWIGFVQVTVDYVREPRAGGIAHFPLFSKNPWKTFVSGLTSFSFLPIYLILAAGLAGLAASGALLVLGALLLLIDRAGAVYWLVTLGIWLWSILMLGQGALGLYVIRIYKDVRGRPAFIIKDAIGFERKPA
jgi:dolichol-phosphate mannosyltransferase